MATIKRPGNQRQRTVVCTRCAFRPKQIGHTARSHTREQRRKQKQQTDRWGRKKCSVRAYVFTPCFLQRCVLGVSPGGGAAELVKRSKERGMSRNFQDPSLLHMTDKWYVLLSGSAVDLRGTRTRKQLQLQYVHRPCDLTQRSCRPIFRVGHPRALLLHRWSVSTGTRVRGTRDVQTGEWSLLPTAEPLMKARISTNYKYRTLTPVQVS